MKKEEIMKSIEILPGSDNPVWKVAGEYLQYDAQLTVGSGCAAIYMVNNIVEQVFMPGSYTINESKRKKEIASLDVLGVNRQKHFMLNWGMGGVAYKDKEFDLSTKVGANGQMDISIFNPSLLVAAFGCNEITVEMIEDRVRVPLSVFATGELTALFNKYSYFTVNSALAGLSKSMQNKMDEILGGYGVLLNSFFVKSLHFSDNFQQKIEERIEQKRRELMAQGERRDELAVELRVKDEQLKMAKELNLAMQNLNMSACKE